MGRWECTSFYARSPPSTVCTGASSYKERDHGLWLGLSLTGEYTSFPHPTWTGWADAHHSAPAPSRYFRILYHRRQRLPDPRLRFFSISAAAAAEMEKKAEARVGEALPAEVEDPEVP